MEAGVPLNAVLPVSGPSFAVRDRDDRDQVWIVEVDDGEGKAANHEPPGSVQVFRPEVRGLSQAADRAECGRAKLRRCNGAASSIPPDRVAESSLASGWNRNGLLSIRELVGKLLEHLFAGDGFYASGANVVDAALDLVVPGGFDAFAGGGFIQAGDQAIDEETTLLRGKGQSLFQEFRELRSDLGRERLARVSLRLYPAETIPVGGAVPEYPRKDGARNRCRIRFLWWRGLRSVRVRRPGLPSPDRRLLD